MRHELDGNLDAILSDYAPYALVATPDGMGSGYDHIRQSHEPVLPLISSLELTVLGSGAGRGAVPHLPRATRRQR
jgi:hypothetical protein